MFLGGLHPSCFEHKLLEGIFGTTADSSVRVLRQARPIGLAPLILDEENLEPTFSSLVVSPDAPASLRNQIARGWRLIIPPESTTAESWRGWGLHHRGPGVR